VELGSEKLLDNVKLNHNEKQQWFKTRMSIKYLKKELIM
jgi:hypothetical protein